jgi:hypothetical protein
MDWSQERRRDRKVLTVAGDLALSVLWDREGSSAVATRVALISFPSVLTRRQRRMEPQVPRFSIPLWIGCQSPTGLPGGGPVSSACAIRYQLPSLICLDSLYQISPPPTRALHIYREAHHSVMVFQVLWTLAWTLESLYLSWIRSNLVSSWTDHLRLISQTPV